MRHLGSFNHQVNLPHHPGDWARQDVTPIAQHPLAHSGYMLGLHHDVHPYEHPLPTTTGPGITGAPLQQRMAGQLLAENLTNSPGTPEALPLPAIGGAEIRVPYLYGV